MILDAHHHLWHYTPKEYGWISETMSVLARDYSVADLQADARPCGVSGSIAVQARQTVAETEALLEIYESGGFVRGVVGWAPLADESIAGVLDSWSGRAGLVGLRHVVQDEPDDDFLDGDDFNRGIAELVRRGLTYDLLVFPRQLPAAIRCVDRHPDGCFVLDHIAKPAIQTGGIEPWRRRIGELARRPNVVCKVSGVVTEADWADWSAEGLRPYLDSVLEAFGPRRLMFGSDWPVCLVASAYERWMSVVQDWTAAWSPEERIAFFSNTAAEAYSIDLEAA